MTNEQKFKSVDERSNAFKNFCIDHECNSCPLGEFRTSNDCQFIWIVHAIAAYNRIFTNENLKRKTIKRADVTGHGVNIIFEDGTIFEYHASDGGYLYREIRHDGESEVK